MKYLALHENKIRGSKEFPFAFYLNKQQTHFELPFHWHDEYEVIYVTKGEFKLTINKDTYTLKKR